jgi:hypothetical protein
MGTFQRTLAFRSHFTGSEAALESPCPVGPRNSGQSSAAAIAASQTKSNPVSRHAAETSILELRMGNTIDRSISKLCG